MKSDIIKIFLSSPAPEYVTDGYGKLITDEYVYIGEFKQGLFDGKGKLYSASGSVYKGEFRQGKKHGFGIEDNCEGTRFTNYVGEYVNGRFEGKGRAVDKQYFNIVYEGNWKEGELSGSGRCSFLGGDFPEDCKDEKIDESFDYDLLLSNPGAFFYDTSEDETFSYEGEWKKGAISGKGTLYYLDTEVYYKGEVSNATPHGEGMIHLKDGCCAVGKFSFGEPEKLYLVYPDRRVYSGEFKGLIPEGKGSVSREDGAKATGVFKNGDMVKGTVEYKDGTRPFDPKKDAWVNKK